MTIMTAMKPTTRSLTMIKQFPFAQERPFVPETIWDDVVGTFGRLFQQKTNPINYPVNEHQDGFPPPFLNAAHQRLMTRSHVGC